MTAVESMVEQAVTVAMGSPCQSKRGVVVWRDSGELVSIGFNHQPLPFQCDGSNRCKQTCGKTAIHAEQSAILLAGGSLAHTSMLHVKARTGRPCASMAPSCLECSKLILASGIEWMHLLHDPEAQLLPGAHVVGTVEGFTSAGELGPLQIRRYSAANFHWLTAEYCHRIELRRA